jgi:pyruvate dehydrogenase E2 component (dihydrolipoamide acetyltransferase)
MSDFRMPSLGADTEDLTLVEWKVASGDSVRRGDVIAVVETDKSAVEIEVFDSGVVGEILVQAGSSVPAGTVLATIKNGESVTPPDSAPVEVPARGESPAPAEAAAAAPVPGRVPKRTRMSPAARKLARELGIAEEGLQGSGPRGAVTRQDIMAAAEASKQKPQAGMRKAIAAAMSRANREIPHYYLSSTIDLGPSTEWLKAHNSDRPPADRLLIGALLIKAVALAVRKVPELNGHYIDGSFRRSEHVHVGMAVALRQGGVIAPAIFDADQCSLEELMRRLKDMVSRAREGRIRGSELTDATITITSLGDRGSDEVFGIINPPQVAMIGFGGIRQGPWVLDGAVVPRDLITASLSADHRVSDGHRGARFQATLAKRLQEPEKL